MRQTFFSLLALIIATTQLAAQEGKPPKQKAWGFSLGTGLGRYQDLKTSAVTYGGSVMRIMFNKTARTADRVSEYQFGWIGGGLNSPLDDVTTLSTTNIRISYSYLKRLSAEIPYVDRWYLGGQYELNSLFLSNSSLGNSSLNIVYNTGFSVVNRFEKGIKLFGRDVTVSHVLNVAVLNFAKESNSFTFSVPQEALENGDYNTQTYSDGVFKYGDIASFGRFNHIGSTIAFDFDSERRSSWSIAYSWQLLAYTKVSNLSVVNASHLLSITYHLSKKSKI